MIIKNEKYLKLVQENWENKHNLKQYDYDMTALRLYVQPNIENILKVPVKEMALDIGYAYGTTSVFLKTLGWKQVIAIDKDDSYVNKEFLEKYGVEFQQGDIMEIDLPKCDLIVFTEVLEHLCGDIQKLFDKFYNSLNNEGYLVLSTPIKGLYIADQIANVSSYKDLIDLQQTSDHIIDAHYYHYTPMEVLELIHNSNLTIKSFQLISKWQYYLIQKL